MAKENNIKLMGYSSKINDPAFENYAEIEHRGPLTIPEEQKKKFLNFLKNIISRVI